MHLGLPEWTVLAVISERSVHGFFVAALTAPGGDLGRIWQIQRPLVYRALGRLESAELVVPQAVESGPGPQRTRYSVTEAGRAAVEEWLGTPVAHVRDMRSELLLKLALLDRRGACTAALLERQRRVLEPIAEAIAAERAACTGFDAVLLAWRAAGTTAAMAFLDDVGAPGPSAPGSRGCGTGR